MPNFCPITGLYIVLKSLSVLSLHVGGRSTLLSRRSGSSVNHIGLMVPRWRFGNVLKLFAQTSIILQGGWTGTTRHYALCNCDRHILQYGKLSEASIDSNCFVVDPELVGHPCAFTIATSCPSSFCVFCCCPPLEDCTELVLPGLNFC